MCYVCLCNFRSFPCLRIRSKDNHTLSQNAAQAEWYLKKIAWRGNGLAFCAEVAGILLFLVLSSLGSDSIFSLCLYYSVDSRNMFQNVARKFDFSPGYTTKTRDKDYKSTNISYKLNQSQLLSEIGSDRSQPKSGNDSMQLCPRNKAFLWILCCDRWHRP